MAREIQFRAWEHDQQKMCYGYQNYIADAEQNNYPLMQFTGICDNTGKEIFEGDVCREWLVDNMEDDGGFWWMAIVEFYNGCWTLKQIGFDYEKANEDPTLLHSERNIEVIGNIYENPELLTQ